MIALTLLLACPPAPTDDTQAKDDNTPSTDSGDTDDSGPPANSAPGAPVVAITPTSPNDLSDLTVTVVTPSVDPDGDVVQYRYAWSVDGTADPSLDDATVSADVTADGQTWTVEVFPTDGLLEGAPGSSTVTIANEPPVAPTIHIDPAAPNGGDTLTLVFDTPATDANGDSLTQVITWYQDGAKNLSWENYTTIDGIYVDGGEVFRAVVTVTDGLSDVLTVEASVTVTNTPPEITSVSVSPSDPTDGEDLSCSARASDEDGEDPTLSYRWLRDGVEATDVGLNDTVDAEFTTVGEVWNCQAEATDGVDTVTALSDDVEVRGSWGYHLRGDVTMVITEDTAGTPSATGEGSWSVYSEGGRYSSNDCDVVWDLVASENTRWCRGCDYSFDAAWTYDSAASDVRAGCSSMAADATGYVTVRAGPQVSAYWDGPTFSMYSYYYYYRSLSLSARGNGGWSSSYYGRYYGYYYGVSEGVDTAGNTVLSAYTDSWSYY